MAKRDEKRPFLFFANTQFIPQAYGKTQVLDSVFGTNFILINLNIREEKRKDTVNPTVVLRTI